MMNFRVPGIFGKQMAQAFKRVPQAQRHATTIQYTQDFSSPTASGDLFSYNRSFDENRDGFYSATEIENASGLNLNRLEHPQDVERLWDRDADGKVNEQEMLVGMAHLDYADGEVDGQITERGRNYVEKKYFDRFNPQHYTSQHPLPVDLTEPPIFKLDPQSVTSVLEDLKQDNQVSPELILGTLRQYLKLEDKPVQDVSKILEAHEAGNPLLEGFPDSFWHYVEAVNEQPPGQDVSNILNAYEELRIQSEMDQAKLSYHEQLQDVQKVFEAEDMLKQPVLAGTGQQAR